MLRPYQEDLLARARKAMLSGVRRILMVAPTGSGKTVLTAQMLKTANEKDMASIFNVHRIELVKQSAQKFGDFKTPYGIIAPGYMPEYDKNIQIASIQTLSRRIQHLKKIPQLIVWDECHHLAAANWTRIFHHFPDAFHIGLTATPQRLDGKGLAPYFDIILEGPTTAELIKMGHLSDYKIFAPNDVDLSGVNKRMGDYVVTDLAAIMDKPRITGNTIKEWQSKALNKKTIVFAVNIEHSKHIVEQFNLAGIKAEHIDGGTDASIREAAIRRFAKGETTVLSNVDIFGEGFDLENACRMKVTIECVILLRPTTSLGLYLQQVGRALRPKADGSHAVILDQVRNCASFGLPDDEREWSLEGAKKNKQKEDSVKICQRCYAAYRPFIPKCPECGFTAPVKAREMDFTEADGELAEIDKDALRAQAKQEQGKAKSREQLLDLAKNRGYKSPHKWVHHIMQARQRKKMGGE